MGLGKKISLLILLVVLCLIVSTGITWTNLKAIEGNVDEVINERVEKIRLVDEIRVNLGMQGLYVRALFISNTEEDQKRLIEYATKLDENIEAFGKFELTEDARAQFELLQVANEDFNNSYKEIINLLKVNDLEHAKHLLVDELQLANLEILNAATEILAIQDEALQEIQDKTTSSISNAKILSLVLVGVSILIAMMTIYFIQKGIIRPLKLVMTAASEISNRRLNGEDISVHSKDEIGQLATIFNTMKAALRSLIREIQTNSLQLQSSSQNLSASSQEISASTEEVTSQVQMSADIAVTSAETANDSAVAMTETAKGVQVIAESSQELQRISDEARTTATAGAAIIDEAQNQMSKISHSTEQVNALVLKLAKQTAEIESISKVISDITDQTNLLALNASIEAARAGEHGKGFAVVADEVKKLANESKDSAVSINALTEEIQADTKDVQTAVMSAINAVGDGVQVISNAGQSFENIVKDVNEMYERINDVSATAEQLSAGSEEVAAAINEISNGAHTASDGLSSIAAVMEEQSATMNDLTEIAMQLSQNATDLEEQVKLFEIE